MGERARGRLSARVAPRLRGLGASYWFVPALMSAAAVALAFVMLAIDRSLAQTVRIPLVYSGAASGARTMLETIAGSMITVAGVVFSITIVALSLASRQYGPMLLRNFMSDRPNQLVLGTFVSTFLYCILVMRAVRGADGELDATFVPELSMTVALLLALTSLAVLIFFIHHIARSIRLEGLLSRVAAQLDRAADRFYPERMGHSGADDVDGARPEELEEAAAVEATHDGYVQSFDEDGLMRLARERDLIIEIRLGPNDFAVRGMTVFRVRPAERCDDDVADRLRRTLVLGNDPEVEDDVRYGIDQLVQLGLRALSPSLNDPLTAMAVIDRLVAIHARVAQCGVPSRCRYDDDGTLRVIARRAGFEDLLRRAFDPIRVNAGRQASVVLHLLESLEKLAPSLRPDQRRAVHDLVRRIGTTSRDDLRPDDWERLEPSCRRALSEAAHEPDEVSGVYSATRARSGQP